MRECGASRAAGLTIAAVLLAAAGSVSAAPFEKGPYLQNVSSSSITVMWESRPPAEGAVELLDGSDRSFASPASGIHEVVIDSLEPGRRYRYRVSSGDETAEGEFATAPEPGAPFSFVVFGDTRSNASAHRRVVERVRREIPDFILDTGDMVDQGASDRDWQGFFDIERDLLRENVLYPSLGNHDRQGRGRTADNFRKYFSLPENSPDPERYYAITYGNARILFLDSNAYSFALTDQTAWIEQQLQAARLDPQIRHIFVSMHHPPFSVSLHGGQAELREAWTPLFERYQVEAVFSGHDHVYTRAEKNGVHYFVSGGGGAPLYPRKHRSDRIDEDAVRYFERVNHYIRVHVFGDLVEASAVRADGTIIETVTWGAPPRNPEAVARLLHAAGGPDESADKGPKAATPPGPAGAVAVARAPEHEGGRDGFGWPGILGGILVLFAGGALVWTIRS